MLVHQFFAPKKPENNGKLKKTTEQQQKIPQNTAKQNKNSKEIADIGGQMIDQIIKSISVIEDSENSLVKATQNLSNAKKYLKDGRGSLFNRAKEMKTLGANNKKDLN